MIADTEAPAPNSCSRSTKSTPAERNVPVMQNQFMALPGSAEYIEITYPETDIPVRGDLERTEGTLIACKVVGCGSSRPDIHAVASNSVRSFGNLLEPLSCLSVV